MTNYEKNIQDFYKMLNNRLTYAFHQIDLGKFDFMDKLCEQNFTLSFMGKSCEICFGATEYDAIKEMLEAIMEEM